ncbi:MAG: hypothetical protein KJP04_10690 [Arenicella sp.]|nr:hypothetical protein [Arenicella sp.]
MAIKTLTEILAALPDNQTRAITEETLRDAFESLVAVGGTMYGSAVDITATTAWQPFAWFTASIDTNGLTEDLTQGHFTLGAGAGGVYAVDASLGIFSNFAGWVEIAVTKNGNLTPYRKKRSLTAGGDGEFGIPASGNLADGDTVGLAMRASGNATITLVDGQFRAFRI